MSTSPENHIIEHVVLFNVKEEAQNINDPDQETPKVNDMINALNNLNSLESVVYLTAGPILRTRSSPLKFTHMLHARFFTLSDLSTYSLHPDHVSVVDSLVRPICDDVMAVDWSADLGSHDHDDNDNDNNNNNVVLVPRPGSAMRVTFFQAEDEKIIEEIFEIMKKIKESLGPYEQVSVGENFSDRGKGYNVASLVMFPDLNELDACEDYEDEMRSLVDKVKATTDGIIALDYLVPRFVTSK